MNTPFPALTSIRRRHGTITLLLLVAAVAYLTILATNKVTALELAAVGPTGAHAWSVLTDPDVITNGSFETGPVIEPDSYLNMPVGSTDITGWTVTRASIDYKGFYWSHFHGDRSIDLDGDASFGGIEQTFATTSGQVYNVGFHMAGNPNGAPTIKTMRVTAAGQHQDFTFDITGKTTQNMGWTAKTWTFTANSSSTTLEFYSRDTVNGSYGPALDNVSVTLVAATNTPTRTPTPTNTPTNTPTPICIAPTPFAYPWCPSAPTATASPTAPGRVSSYYVEPTNTPPLNATPTPQGGHGVWWNQGYDVADSMITNGGPYFGVAILGFGKPDVTLSCPSFTCPLIWRARIIGGWDPPIYLSISEIEDLAAEFAAGFHKRASDVTPPGVRPWIKVAVGTTNYWSPGRPLISEQFYEHGRQWGLMVKRLNENYDKYYPLVQFEGAYDTEFAWSDADHALRWSQGFEEVTRPPCSFCRGYYYYLYGSCDDCYYPGQAGGDPDDTILANYHPEATRIPLPGQPTSTPISWTLDQAVGVTIANRAALPLPQIYYPTSRTVTNQPQQWAWMSSYAATHYLCLEEYAIPRGIRGAGDFRGIMADGTGGEALPPGEAWQRLWMALNSRSCTSDAMNSLQYVTPIRYFPVTPPQ